MAHSILLATLGRNATDQELSQFAGALRQYEQKHPSVTSSTTDTLNNKTTSSTSGGVSDQDRVQFLNDKVFGGQLRNEANAFAVDGYVEALQKLLGGGA